MGTIRKGVLGGFSGKVGTVVVERRSGVSRNKILTLADAADYIPIIEAMSFVENGRNADISEIHAGFILQTKITSQ